MQHGFHHWKQTNSLLSFTVLISIFNQTLLKNSVWGHKAKPKRWECPNSPIGVTLNLLISKNTLFSSQIYTHIESKKNKKTKNKNRSSLVTIMYNDIANKL